MQLWLLVAHGILAGVFAFVLLMAPQYMIYQKIVPPARTILTMASIAAAFALLIVLVTRRFGLRYLRSATLIPVVGMLFFLLHSNGWLLDANYSARPLAREIEQRSPGTPLLVTHFIRRDMDYGLCFYRKQPLRHYLPQPSTPEKQFVITGIPQQEHILVLRSDAVSQLPDLLPNRVYEPLLLNQWEGLAVYKVAAAPVSPVAALNAPAQILTAPHTRGLR